MNSLIINRILLLAASVALLSTYSCDKPEDPQASEKSDINANVEKHPILACSECDHVVAAHVTDGEELGIKPGDIICLSASEVYNRLIFKNLKGTEENPIIVQNCDGTALIYSEDAFGLKFEDSEHFILTGSGTQEGYGIKVTTTTGFYVSMEHFTTNFEIARIEIAGKHPNKDGSRKDAGFAGIGIKTSPYQDCDRFADPGRQAWIMRNVSVHDNYIHDTGGEGLYIGHGFYKGRKEPACDQVTYSHSIKGLRVFNNLIENVGYDGMQIKNADEDVEVYNNVVRNYGTKNHNAHNEGLFIGEGTVGKFYNNLIETGTGNGCQLQGMGNIDLFNNIFANQQQNGIYAAHGEMVVRIEDAPFNIFNNTIVNSGEHGYIFHNEDGGPKRFINNLIVNAGTLESNDATTEKRNNLFTNELALVNFLHTDLKNYRLGLGSEAIDAGLDLSTFGIDADYEGVPRPQGTTFDIGAHEYTE